MAKIIKISICLTDIEKERIYNHQNGKKYLSLIVKEKPMDQFKNDWMVSHDTTKEEREAKKYGKIIGNGRTLGGGGSNSSGAPTSTTNTDDLPY